MKHPMTVKVIQRENTYSSSPQVPDTRDIISEVTATEIEIELYFAGGRRGDFIKISRPTSGHGTSSEIVLECSRGLLIAPMSSTKVKVGRGGS